MRMSRSSTIPPPAPPSPPTRARGAPRAANTNNYPHLTERRYERRRLARRNVSWIGPRRTNAYCKYGPTNPKKMRASLVHSQRMSHHHVSISGLFEGMAQELSESSCSTSSASQASIPLVHVQHGSSSSSTPRGRESFSHQTMGDLGRTPTASNCSDLRKLQQLGSCPSQFLYTLPVDVTLPVGVHVISANRQCKTNLQRVAAPAAAPLGFHPQLASRIPTPPPKLVASLPSVRKVSSVSEVESREVEESKSLQYMNHPATMDDVMEVAMTLSKLGERTGSVPRRTGSIPRIR
mmetsp:Transcript_19130/g.31212  ORF Transcript_19130/g.31212 Transcript_19130/m.31212 type:complete len:293 (+) Transcript_19130:1315-2193(+)